MNAEIQIQFPQPGNWQEFTLTAIYQDAGGYRPPARYTADEIPAEQTPAMAAVVSALVGMGEDWQAVQVWAHLMTATIYSEDDPYTPVGQRTRLRLMSRPSIRRAGGGCSRLMTTRLLSSRTPPPWLFSNTSSGFSLHPGRGMKAAACFVP